MSINGWGQDEWLGEERREHFRVAGPFDGTRVGLIDTAISVHEISRTGCFVGALYGGVLGERVTLTIDLHDTVISVEGETTSVSPGFGFAVSFNSIGDAARVAIDALVERSRQLLAG